MDCVGPFFFSPNNRGHKGKILLGNICDVYMLFYNGLKNRCHDNDTYCHAAHSAMLLWLNMEACLCSATQTELQQRHMETLPQQTKLSEYNKSHFVHLLNISVIAVNVIRKVID